MARRPAGRAAVGALHPFHRRLAARGLLPRSHRHGAARGAGERTARDGDRLVPPAARPGGCGMSGIVLPRRRLIARAGGLALSLPLLSAGDAITEATPVRTTMSRSDERRDGEECVIMFSSLR